MLAQLDPSSIQALSSLSLSSVAGVAASTSIIVNRFIKPHLSQVAFLKKVPLIVFSLAVSLILTAVADKILHTLNGDLASLLIATATSTLGAAGIFHLPGALQSLEDVAKPTDPPIDPPTPPTPPAPPTAPISGVAIAIKKPDQVLRLAYPPLRLAGMFLCVIGLFTACGCATSPQTQLMISRVVPGVANNAARYANALPEPAKSDRIARIERLRSTVPGKVKDISGAAVSIAWADVEPLYLADIDADPSLSPIEKQLRHLVVSKLDQVLREDASRPLAGLLNTFFPPHVAPLVVPVVAQPATQP